MREKIASGYHGNKLVIMQFCCHGNDQNGGQAVSHSYHKTHLCWHGNSNRILIP